MKLLKTYEIPKPGKFKTRRICTFIEDLNDSSIIKMLTDKYEEYLLSHGIASPIAWRKNINGIKQLNKLSSKDKILCLDLSNCFDMIDTTKTVDIIQNKLKVNVTSDEINSLLLKNEHIYDDFKFHIAQGARSSPILCNISLLIMDEFIENTLKNEKVEYVRFGDDIRIGYGNDLVVNQFIEKLSNYIWDELKVKLNCKKTKVIGTKTGGFILGKVWIDSAGIRCTRKYKRLLLNNAMEYAKSNGIRNFIQQTEKKG